LEKDDTAMMMAASSSLSGVCIDLFGWRQVLSQVFVLFFKVLDDGCVWERRSREINWAAVTAFIREECYHRYMFADCFPYFLSSMRYKGEHFGSDIIRVGCSFLHFLCRFNHPSMLNSLEMYHELNLSRGCNINAHNRDATYGSPAAQFRLFFDMSSRDANTDKFASESSIFAFLRDKFREGPNYIEGSDDYGEANMV
jgi:hypothetical protein